MLFLNKKILDFLFFMGYTINMNKINAALKIDGRIVRNKTIYCTY